MNGSKLQQYDSEIIKHYLAGKSANEISKIYNTCDNAINYRLKINGIKKRSISEANRNRPKSELHRKKLSESRIKSGIAKGNRNPNWKGGVQDNWSELKNSTEYKLWRKSVFERDNYTCTACGDNRGGNLQAHHILPRRKFPHLILSISSGKTLCKKCHEKLYKTTWDIINSDELLELPNVKTREISSQAGV